MAKFSVKRTVEGGLEDIRKNAGAIDMFADEIKHIASELSGNGTVYDRLARTLNALSKEVLSEGQLMDKYSETGLTAIRLYFETERKLCNSAMYDVAKACASSGEKTQKEIDKHVDFLRKLLILLLSHLNISKRKKELYLWYLEKYRQHLYDENGIDLIIPTPKWIYEEEQRKKQIEEEKRKQEEEARRKQEEEARRKQEEEARKKQEEEERKRKEEEERKRKEEEERKRKEEEERKRKEEEERKKKIVDRTPNYSNKLFDNKGLYGARQRLPKDKGVYDAIRIVHPGWTDAQCNNLINKLGPEGCGYAATANSILYAYEGRAEEFESTFGISMYKNGDLNYDELVAYIYAKYDDPNMDGLTPGHQEEIIEKMLEGTGHESMLDFYDDINSVDVQSELNNGLLTIGTQGSFDVTPVGGGKTLHYDEAHVMTVTGVAPDGRLIVSTWGEKYYLDPDTCYRPYYASYKFDTRGNI